MALKLRLELVVNEKDSNLSIHDMYVVRDEIDDDGRHVPDEWLGSRRTAQQCYDFFDWWRD